METILAGIGVVAVALYLVLLVGGPMLLMDWLRNWRDETTRRQIALTDAIDAELGAIVAPVVKKPLWGPWQIRIAVPITQPAAVGTILVVAHEVFTASDRMSPDRYQIVLTPKQDPIREERKTRASQPAVRWHGDTIAAA